MPERGSTLQAQQLVVGEIDSIVTKGVTWLVTHETIAQDLQVGDLTRVDSRALLSHFVLGEGVVIYHNFSQIELS